MSKTETATPGGVSEKHLHTLAVGAIVKDTALKEAKQALPDRFSRRIRINARIDATITKGASTPGTSGSSPATVQPDALCTIPIVAEVMRRLKVTPAQLRKAMKATAPPGKPDPNGELAGKNQELQAVFGDIANAIAEKLPPVNWKSGGSSGPVHVTGGFEVTDVME